MARHEREHLSRYYAPLLLFFASILGLVCAADWFFFIIFWEIMTACSYVLVVFEQGNAVNLRAGFKYVLITHAASACMFIAAILIWQFGPIHSFSFAASKEAMAHFAAARPLMVHLLLGLWFIGFVTKAGVLPFGNWLPDAYPAAPGGASAAFGGVMTKLGIYGILRVFCWMLPPSEYSQVWGLVIAIFATGSVFIGTLSTLPENIARDDSKRFLSLHVIGQIGYILLGIGMGIYFLPTHPSVALLALMAGVFHLVNNVCYKTLLFLTAGSVLFRSGTRDLNRVSGMGAVMPLTALTATVGSLAIAGLPPFNGFVSKWMLYNVSILSPQPMPLFLVFGIIAIFISLVTLTSFLKYLGSAFLGPVAAPEGNSVDKGEVPITMQIPQVVLAGLCVLFGLVPVLALSGVYRAVVAAVPSGLAPSFASLMGDSPAGLKLIFNSQTGGVWFPSLVLIVLAICMGLGWWLSRLGGAAKRQVSEWHCGAPVTNEMARYEARSFYGPFKKAFSGIYPMVGVPKAGYPEGLARVFNVDNWLFGPLVEIGGRLTGRISRAHIGIPQMYLIWQVAGAALVMAALFWLLR